MRRIPFACLAIIASLGIGVPVIADEKLFDGAGESDDQLRSLYDEAGDICLRNPSRDVQVAVACKAMTIYGLALNERGWCYGRSHEANAEMSWHSCEADSIRFSVDHLTDF